jgi:hypothetical protein
MGRFVVGICGGLLVAGCASLPKVQITYYPPVAHTVITVTQVLDCDKSGKKVIAANSVAAATTYSSDRDHPPQHFAIADLDGTFSDADLTFGFTDDGRLKSVNAATTGQAETIVNSAISLTTAILVAGGGKRNEPTACSTIANWGKDKPLTLIQSVTLVSDKTFAAGEVALIPQTDSLAVYNALKPFNVPQLDIKVRVGAAKPITPPAVDAGTATDVVFLHLNGTAEVPLTVLAKDNKLWSGTVVIPTGTPNDLPIPKSALFGKQTFALTLSDAGQIVSVQYAKAVGISGALNASGAVVKAATPESATDRAAAAKGKADEIAQLARLARCEKDPNSCS